MASILTSKEKSWQIKVIAAFLRLVSSSVFGKAEMILSLSILHLYYFEHFVV